MRILIADDSIVSRHLLDATLRKWGYEVVVACDGIEAWNALRADDAPKLAILDWVMPGLTGLEVCRNVREQVLVGVAGTFRANTVVQSGVLTAIYQIDATHFK